MYTKPVGREGIIKRAYELADTGLFADNAEICIALKHEGFSNTLLALAGRALNTDLRQRCRLARGVPIKETKTISKQPVRRRSRYADL
jgi:hypothetical protein